MKRVIRSYLFLALSTLHAQHGDWTWLHSKMFKADERAHLEHKKRVMYEKIDLPPFNQLVFSWNASRPKQGHFAFWAQVRDTKTGKWSKWVCMMKWGADVQQSFNSSADTLRSYHHVRFEMGKRHANGFRIKITSHNGASLKQLSSFSVSLSDLNKLLSEEADYSLPTIHIKGLPLISQFELNHPKNDSLCSPTSCAMLMSYLLNKPVHPLDFAEKAYDRGLGAYGSWPFNIAHAFEISGGAVRCSVARLHTFKELYARLFRGLPVIVSVRGPLQGSATPYASGHLLVVVGWDNKTKEVICHDPAFQPSESVVKRYPIKDFLVAWERSKRLAYLFEYAMEDHG